MATQRTIDGFKRVGRMLRTAGYRVVFMSGWTTRGKGDMHVRGLVNHHDASTEASGDDGALRVVMYGREGLRNSLSAFTVARYSGTIRVVAAGRSWHAGYGDWRGEDDLNTWFAGDEAAGTTGEQWTPASLRAQLALNVAVCLEFGVDPGDCPEHKDTDPNRKVDRYAIDGRDWRRQVAEWVRRGEVPPADGTDTGEFTVRDEDKQEVKAACAAALKDDNYFAIRRGVELLLTGDGDKAKRSREAIAEAVAAKVGGVEGGLSAREVAEAVADVFSGRLAK